MVLHNPKQADFLDLLDNSSLAEPASETGKNIQNICASVSDLLACPSCGAEWDKYVWRSCECWFTLDDQRYLATLISKSNVDIEMDSWDSKWKIVISITVKNKQEKVCYHIPFELKLYKDFTDPSADYVIQEINIRDSELLDTQDIDSFDAFLIRSALRNKNTIEWLIRTKFYGYSA